MSLIDKIKACTKCSLYKKMPDGCKPVPGIGPANAKLMILGEALGKDESIMEEPFVGLCGKFLTKCMAEAGIKREDCYITNCVKCRPTDTGTKNRPPSKDEYNYCIPWFKRELELVQPKAILGLGKFAAMTLLYIHNPVMKNIVGKEQTYTYNQIDYRVICTYHPSFVQNYGVGYNEIFIEHLKAARKLAYGI